MLQVKILLPTPALSGLVPAPKEGEMATEAHPLPDFAAAFAEVMATDAGTPPPDTAPPAVAIAVEAPLVAEEALLQPKLPDTPVTVAAPTPQPVDTSEARAPSHPADMPVETAEEEGPADPRIGMADLICLPPPSPLPTYAPTTVAALSSDKTADLSVALQIEGTPTSKAQPMAPLQGPQDLTLPENQATPAAPSPVLERMRAPQPASDLPSPSLPARAQGEKTILPTPPLREVQPAPAEAEAGQPLYKDQALPKTPTLAQRPQPLVGTAAVPPLEPPAQPPKTARIGSAPAQTAQSIAPNPERLKPSEGRQATAWPLPAWRPPVADAVTVAGSTEGVLLAPPEDAVHAIPSAIPAMAPPSPPPRPVPADGGPIPAPQPLIVLTPESQPQNLPAIPAGDMAQPSAPPPILPRFRILADIPPPRPTPLAVASIGAAQLGDISFATSPEDQVIPLRPIQAWPAKPVPALPSAAIEPREDRMNWDRVAARAEIRIISPAPPQAQAQAPAPGPDPALPIVSPQAEAPRQGQPPTTPAPRHPGPQPMALAPLPPAWPAPVPAPAETPVAALIPAPESTQPKPIPAAAPIPASAALTPPVTRQAGVEVRPPVPQVPEVSHTRPPKALSLQPMPEARPPSSPKGTERLPPHPTVPTQTAEAGGNARRPDPTAWPLSRAAEVLPSRPAPVAPRPSLRPAVPDAAAPAQREMPSPRAAPTQTSTEAAPQTSPQSAPQPLSQTAPSLAPAAPLPNTPRQRPEPALPEAVLPPRAQPRVAPAPIVSAPVTPSPPVDRRPQVQPPLPVAAERPPTRPRIEDAPPPPGPAPLSPALPDSGVQPTPALAPPVEAAATTLAAPPPAATPIAAPQPLSAPAQAMPLPRNLPSDLVRAASRAEEGDKVELTLDPVELGRVRFELAHGAERMQITISVERPETLDLLRRHADALRAEFRDAGFDAASLNFGQWGGGDSQRRPETPSGLPPAQAFLADTPPDLPPARPEPRRLAPIGNLDLRI